MKTITINVPDDCEVQIVKKEEKKEPVIRTYQDLINNAIRLNGYSIDYFSKIQLRRTKSAGGDQRNIASS